jgi:hypothetical protein
LNMHLLTGLFYKKSCNSFLDQRYISGDLSGFTALLINRVNT